MRLLGISRSKKFSPNMAGKDEAIFMSVVTKLVRKGHEVSILAEDVFVAPNLSEFDLVFSMARGVDVLRVLVEARSGCGLRVLNSPEAVLRNARAELVSLFAAAGVPQPASVVLDLSEGECSRAAALGRCAGEGMPDFPGFPLWLKRGDACAQGAGDVCFVESEASWESVLSEFRRRGILRAVVVAHAEGDLLKFYGVEGNSFFHFTYPTAEGGFSKFGLEVHNGSARHFAFDCSALKACADKAARVSGFSIYGGDAVVRADGSFQIIDFNDWPSFSSCRKAAAEAIVERIENELSGISLH